MKNYDRYPSSFQVDGSDFELSIYVLNGLPCQFCNIPEEQTIVMSAAARAIVSLYITLCYHRRKLSGQMDMGCYSCLCVAHRRMRANAK